MSTGKTKRKKTIICNLKNPIDEAAKILIEHRTCNSMNEYSYNHLQPTMQTGQSSFLQGK